MAPITAAKRMSRIECSLPFSSREITVWSTPLMFSTCCCVICVTCRPALTQVAI